MEGKATRPYLEGKATMWENMGTARWGRRKGTAEGRCQALVKVGGVVKPVAAAEVELDQDCPVADDMGSKVETPVGL